MDETPNPMHNIAEAYAKAMIESLISVTMLVGLYKGSERREHLKAAADWIPNLESSLAGLKRELLK